MIETFQGGEGLFRISHDFVGSSDGSLLAYKLDDRLRVVSIAGAPKVLYTSETTDAGYWLFSPDGTFLLSLHVISQEELHWESFHLPSQKVTRYSVFSQCDYLMNTYLPFQSQYWQSLTIISPDSKVRSHFFILICPYYSSLLRIGVRVPSGRQHLGPKVRRRCSASEPRTG